MTFTCKKCGEVNEIVMESTDAQFAEFWAAYPHKVGKGAAERAWAKCAKQTPYLLVLTLEALKWQITSKKWTEGFIPNPATYLNQKRWMDQPDVIIQTKNAGRDVSVVMKGKLPDDWDRRYEERYGK